MCLDAFFRGGVRDRRRLAGYECRPLGIGCLGVLDRGHIESGKSLQDGSEKFVSSSLFCTRNDDRCFQSGQYLNVDRNPG